jgi:hypothetical protein
MLFYVDGTEHEIFWNMIGMSVHASLMKFVFQGGESENILVVFLFLGQCSSRDRWRGNTGV